MINQTNIIQQNFSTGTVFEVLYTSQLESNSSMIYWHHGGYAPTMEVAEEAAELIKSADGDTQKRGFGMLETDED